ncbi:MAG: MBL fold metallo-hydrolase [Deltaproteobacteria bacterium]
MRRAVLFASLLATSACTAMGANPRGERLAKMQEGLRWNGDGFMDLLPRRDPSLGAILSRFLGDGGSQFASPADEIPIVPRTRASFAEPTQRGLRITWLGHSTLLIEIDGKTILTDPVWGERASPATWAGPQRFHPPPLPFEELPKIDAVVISHDHYDHLDYPTILRFVETDVPFYVPLGVGAHLELWGIPPERIHEHDWWDVAELGKHRLVSVPSRHFSGRSLADRDQTLWTGWVITGPRRRVYFSGDTSFFPAMAEIGRRYGPFDATMIESGAYNQLWSDVHVGPEQAVEAHRLVRGKVLIPVHWGTFDLALHGWTEPIERVLAAAKKAKVVVLTPRPGQSFEPGIDEPPARWWPEVEWTSADQEPVRATSRNRRIPAVRFATPPEDYPSWP